MLIRKNVEELGRKLTRKERHLIEINAKELFRDREGRHQAIGLSTFEHKYPDYFTQDRINDLWRIISRQHYAKLNFFNCLYHTYT